MMVMMMAKTPSLKASSLPLCIMRAPRVVVRRAGYTITIEFGSRARGGDAADGADLVVEVSHALDISAEGAFLANDGPGRGAEGRGLGPVFDARRDGAFPVLGSGGPPAAGNGADQAGGVLIEPRGVVRIRACD